MKIAVATEKGTTISSHFGRSPFFTIFEIVDGKIVGQSTRQNTFTKHFRGHHGDHQQEEHPHGPKEETHDHDSVADGLGDCSVVISHGMGRRAWEDLRARGIEMIVTDETDAEQAARLYVAGNLRDHVERLH